MKQKITVQISEQIFDRLEASAQAPGATKAAIVEAALNRFLDPAAEIIDDAALVRWLNSVSGKLDQLQRDLKLANETVALHARYHFAVTPPMPQLLQRAACQRGLERFEVFAEQIGRRVELNTPLTQETLDRLSDRGRDPSAQNADQSPTSGRPHIKPVPEVSALLKAPQNLQLVPAAAREGGGNEMFQRQTGTPCPETANTEQRPGGGINHPAARTKASNNHRQDR
jgi:hypothetical protein